MYKTKSVSLQVYSQFPSQTCQTCSHMHVFEALLGSEQTVEREKVYKTKE